jgi:predicted membrane-bound spermidine synthase
MHHITPRRSDLINETQAAIADTTSGGGEMRLLAFPFFTSGVAALTYQICWQRLLFVAFGVDIESITIIVSAFMLGLGVGALLGGQLADRYPSRIVVFFALTEFLIGGFGLLSPYLINQVGLLTMQFSAPVVTLSNFILLLLPTTLMGATLPMLVAFLVKRSKNVGVSIGSLYFINTLGAAAGAAATGFIVFHYLDLIQTIHAAAALNLLAGTLVLWLFRGEAK